MITQSTGEKNTEAIMEDVEIPIKSCFKYRELGMDSSNRNWNEESYLYMKDWIKELNPPSRSWISDSHPNTSNEDEWSLEFQSYSEDWEMESETELNIHVRDWIAEFGDWEMTSDIRVRAPTLNGFEDIRRDPSETCGICIDTFQNLTKFGVLENCWHKFCFLCIERWSHFKHSCPMCRAPFKCIIKRHCGLIISIADIPPLRPTAHVY